VDDYLKTAFIAAYPALEPIIEPFAQWEARVAAQRAALVQFQAWAADQAAGTPLPNSVYDDWANPAVGTITMPAGDYRLQKTNVANSSRTLVLNRSNVTINFAGCTLLVDPAEGANSGFYPVQIASVPVTSPVFLPASTPDGVASRSISHVTGTIASGTTTLTMDPDEIVTMQAGEVVLIWAGVTPSDPVEPEAFIPATVQSIDIGTGVITFTAGLGQDITNYGSLAALTAEVESGLQWKIGEWGTWPSYANYSKGYGLDHGLERFVGGMVHDVILNDLTLELEPISDGLLMPNGMWDVSVVAATDITINNVSIANPHGNTIHIWRSLNVLVDGATFTGAGSSKIWNSSTAEACAFTAWGGDGLTFRDVSITGTDIAAFNTEVRSTNIWVDGLDYNVAFTAARTYVSSPTVLGFFSVGADVPLITNASLQVTPIGGSLPIYITYYGDFDGTLAFPGGLTDWFNWGSNMEHGLLGTVTLDGVTYGPATVNNWTETITSGPSVELVTVPAGLYTAARIRVTTDGDLRNISDTFGHNYWVPATGTAWITVPTNKWFSIGAGAAALTAYLTKGFYFWMNSNGGAPNAVVEIETTYLPEVP